MALFGKKDNVEIGEKKKGFFSRLVEGLSKSRENVGGRVEDLVVNTRVIDEDFYEELTDILIMSDMGMKTTDQVIEELKARVASERTKSAQRAHEILRAILKEMMTMPRAPLKWPMVMLVVGVNGVGKTTTIGKLALRFKDAHRHAGGCRHIPCGSGRSAADLGRACSGSDHSA